jgi:hypothetical protein
MILKSIFLAPVLLFSVICSAETDPSFVISSVSVTPIESEKISQLELKSMTNLSQVSEVIAIVDGILAVGTKIWNIVEAGRPVVTTSFSPSISALPETTGESGVLRQMANWSVPKIQSYRISYKNGFNKEVVAFNYTVYFQFNGSYKGVGKYITNLKVQASKITAAWGFNLNASSELVGIANVGSDEAPIASAILQITYGVKGFFNEVRNTQGFYVDGSGAVKLIQ